MVLSSFVAVLLLCVTHIFVHRLGLTGIPRSRWLSVAGGISVTYIFLEAFPELHHIQRTINEKEYTLISRFADMEVYLLSLLGLIFFYGLENRTRKSKESRRRPDEGREKNIRVYWIHILSFAVYNFIIGYLLIHREESSFQGLLEYSVAMAFHFIVTDHALEDHFSSTYRRSGRWLLVGSIFVGWMLSLMLKVPAIFLKLVFAFLAGGVIMNVLKEELPEERESNLLAFCIGVIVYGSVVVVM